MKYIINLLVLLTTGLFSLSLLAPKKDYIAMSNRITNKTAKALATKYNMDWLGGGGGFMYNINKISTSFSIAHPIDRNEARKLIVEAVETYLKAINEDLDIRPFLINYPFTINNLKVVIFSTTAEGDNVYDPYISITRTWDNEIRYITDDPKDKWHYKTEYVEPYEMALQIVKEQGLLDQPVNPEEPQQESSWFRSFLNFFKFGSK